MDISRFVSEENKVWLSALAVPLALLWNDLPKKVRWGALALLTVVATLNYARFGPNLVLKTVDAYDLAHYYLNAKYFDELGYYDLYPAMIVADHDNGGPFYDEGRQYMAQDETGHGFKPIAHAVARGQMVRDTKFTPDRWAAFEHDSLYLQRETGAMTDDLWRQMIQDHGYNGTPVWTVLAMPFTVLPVESVKLLCYLDLFLLIGATAALRWAYGREVAVWGWLFLMLTYSARWPTITWAFLRYDYLVALLVAMSLLKKGRMGLAGAFVGLSAASRLFPLMWMWGPFCKGVAGLFRRTVDRKLVTLALGVVLTVGVLEGVAAAVLGPDQVVVHIENMRDHNSAEQLSSRRIGLATALPFRGELLPKNISNERRREIGEQKNLRYGIAVATMVVLGFALRRKDEDETFAYGFLPFFLLTTASYYYYVTRVTLWVLHASRLDKLRHRVGLGMLAGLELFTNWAETHHEGHRVYLVGMLSWGLALYTATQIVWMLFEREESAV